MPIILLQSKVPASDLLLLLGFEPLPFLLPVDSLDSSRDLSFELFIVCNLDKSAFAKLVILIYSGSFGVRQFAVERRADTGEPLRSSNKLSNKAYPTVSWS